MHLGNAPHAQHGVRKVLVDVSDDFAALPISQTSIGYGI